MSRGQDAVEPRRVTSAWRDQGREPTAPGRTVGDPRGAAGGLGSSEVVLDAAIGTQGQAVGRDQRPEHVADESLERGAITRVDDGVGMEGEAIDERCAAARREDSRRGLGKRDRQLLWVPMRQVSVNHIVLTADLVATMGLEAER